MYPYLTDDDIQFLEENERQYVQEFLKKYELKTRKLKYKPVFATAVSKSSIQEKKYSPECQPQRELECLNWLRQKMRDADPIARKKFMDKIEGVEF